MNIKFKESNKEFTLNKKQAKIMLSNKVRHTFKRQLYFSGGEDRTLYIWDKHKQKYCRYKINIPNIYKKINPAEINNKLIHRIAENKLKHIISLQK